MASQQSVASLRDVVPAAWRVFRNHHRWAVATSLLIGLPLNLFLILNYAADSWGPTERTSFIVVIYPIVAAFVSVGYGLACYLVETERRQEQPGSGLLVTRTIMGCYRAIGTQMLVFLAISWAMTCFLLPGLMLAVFLVFAMPAFVSDGQSGDRAFVRSYRVVSQDFWRYLGRILGLGLGWIACGVASLFLWLQLPDDLVFGLVATIPMNLGGFFAALCLAELYLQSTDRLPGQFVADKSEY